MSHGISPIRCFCHRPPLQLPSISSLTGHLHHCRAFLTSAGHCTDWSDSIATMQGFRRRGALWMGLMVVLAAIAFADSEPVCNVKDLYPCLATAKGAYPPEPDQKCCSMVMEANPSCLCSEFVNTKMPDSFIKNVLAIPKACGRYQLSGTKCGSYTIE